MKNENMMRFGVSRSEIKKMTTKEIKEETQEEISQKKQKKPLEPEENEELGDRRNDDEEEDEDENNENEVEIKDDVPPYLTSTREFALDNKDKFHDIYLNYAQAMERRNRRPLDERSFISHFFHRGPGTNYCMYGTPERGYLLGVAKYGVFVPSHFAPKNIRKGYELMKDLGASKEVPAVMTITEDLLETIKKMPEWKHVDFTFLAKFREDLVEKKVVYNSHPKVQQMMYALLYDYLEEREKTLPKGTLGEYDEVA